MRTAGGVPQMAESPSSGSNVPRGTKKSHSHAVPYFAMMTIILINRDLARFHSFGLGQLQIENAVVHASRDSCRVDGRIEFEAPPKVPIKGFSINELSLLDSSKSPTDERQLV